MPTRSRPRGSSPLLTWHWLLAFLALVCNDHLLKNSTWLPAAITGKLSDVAGLYVAPPLLALVLGSYVRLLFGGHARCGRGLLWSSAAAVGLGLTALKLSPQFARTVETAITMLGLPSRIEPDPTDLWTLPTLLVSLWVFAPRFDAARSRGQGSEPESPSATRLHRAAVVVGALGCAATTSTPQLEPEPRVYWSNAPAVVNSSQEHSITLRVRPLRADLAVDCERLAEDPGQLFPQGAFNPLQRVQLAPLGTFDLAFWGGGNDTRACVAALIQLEGSAPKLVFWTPLPSRPYFMTWEQLPTDDPETILVTFDGETATGFSDVNSSGESKELLFDFEPRAEDRGCASERPPGQAWAASGQGVGSYRVVRRSDLPDGCVRLELGWPSPTARESTARESNESTEATPPATRGSRVPTSGGAIDAGALDGGSTQAYPNDAGDADAAAAARVDAGRHAAGDAGPDTDAAIDATDEDAELLEDDGSPAAVLAPMAPGIQAELVLCIPSDAVPFLADSSLDIDELTPTQLTLSAAAKSELRLFTGSEPLPSHPFEFSLADGETGTACAFVTQDDPPRTSRPASLLVNGPWGAVSLGIGETQTFDAGSRRYVAGTSDAREVILSLSTEGGLVPTFSGFLLIEEQAE